MVSALVVSTLFLVSYATYHWIRHGVVTRYEGQGILRLIYFFILLTHTPLAAIVPIFAIKATLEARNGDFIKHKKITRWLLPVWGYVSVTGILVYLMLYIF